MLRHFKRLSRRGPFHAEIPTSRKGGLTSRAESDSAERETTLAGAENGSNARRNAALLRIATMIVLSIAFAGIVGAQVLYGTLTGTVTDPTGAVVPGAKVSVKNTATGAERADVTNDSGVFQFADLQPGNYTVVISSSSFKTQIQENVAVIANNIKRIDGQLQVGEMKESVTVTDTPTTLQTDRGDVNVTQTGREVNNLPLFGSTGRNYQSVMSLIPGAISAGEQNSTAGSPQRSISYNVNGVSRMQNNTRIDGASIVYPWLPTNTAYVPPAESIQEVNIVTNAFDAEQGLAGGAFVNVSLKSGGNGFHGSGWGYETPHWARSRTFFQSPTQVNNPKNLLTQYGYTVGGPIIKNKLFFFTDLERTTQRGTGNTNFFTLAPINLRPDANGNVNFTGTGITVYDPNSNVDPVHRTPFANDTIPANRIDQGSLALIKNLPAPINSNLTQNFVGVGRLLFNRTNFDNKINWNVSDKMTMFGRFSYSPTLVFDPSVFGGAGGPALNGGQVGNAPGKVYIASVGGTYIFSPTVVLDVVAGYTRQHLGAENTDLGTNFGLDVMHIPGTNGPDRLQGGIPSFQISGFTNLGNDNTGNPFVFRDNQYTLASNLAWSKGVHSFRFGAELQDQQLNHFQPQGGTFQTVRGTFVFAGNATKLQGDAGSVGESPMLHAWADFLLGLPSAAGKVDQLRNPNSVYMKSYAFYARDHWQIGKNLTLTYGVRLENYLFPTKDHTGINRYDPATGQVFTGGLSGVPENTGAKSGIGLFLPRIGLAYRWGDKTVLRGGYGQSADPRPFIDFRNAYPIVNAWAMATIKFGGFDNSFIPVTTFRQGLINTGGTPDLTQGILALPSNSGTTTYPKTPMRDRIHSFNFLIERELPWKFTSQIGYVGTRAVGQMGFININASAPGTGNAGRPLFGNNQDINEILPYGTTTYDALQARISRRFAGSIIGAAYTWSKAINYADNDANPRIQFMPDKAQNRGPASYDRASNLELYTVYDLPFGKGQQWAKDGFASKVFGGFQFNGTMTLLSGAPFYVVQGTAPALLAGGSSQVPDQVNSVVAIFGGHGNATTNPGVPISGLRYFDTTAYTPENGAQFGTAGRNNLRGPGFWETDIGIFRTFNFGERFRFQLRAEAINALNHANFANPASDISNAGTFGLISGLTGPNQSRQWRFGGRFLF